MKNKLIGLQAIRDIFFEKGFRASYGKIYYIVKFHPSFPNPVFLPGYKKPKWREKEVEKWVDDFLEGKLPEQRDPQKIEQFKNDLNIQKKED